jgi:hypothetical protein
LILRLTVKTVSRFSFFHRGIDGKEGDIRGAWLIRGLVDIFHLTALTLTLSHPMGEGTAIG